MGFSLANELAANGAVVILVSGPVQIELNNASVKLIKVNTAEQMYKACIEYFSDVDGAVLCAAVADYTPETVSNEKIKTKEPILIKLKPTKDIAAELGKRKTEKQMLVGFALETNNEIENAVKKLRNKNLNFIVLNSLNDEGAGFRKETNKITIIDSTGKQFDYPVKTKTEVAKDIVQKMIAVFESL
jgi:phosphopantothenoylcysteine decarboxylase/phosphopantothenate--cysteine ligase